MLCIQFVDMEMFQFFNEHSEKQQNECICFCFYFSEVDSTGKIS